MIEVFFFFLSIKVELQNVNRHIQWSIDNSFKVVKQQFSRINQLFEFVFTVILNSVWYESCIDWNQIVDILEKAENQNKIGKNYSQFEAENEFIKKKTHFTLAHNVNWWNPIHEKFLFFSLLINFNNFTAFFLILLTFNTVWLM